MHLHANAALSLNQRRRMVVRVVEHGWSLTKAAEAAEVSERTCSKWVARYRVKLAIVSNPYTPVNVALGLLSSLHEQDLREVAASSTLAEALRAQAERLLQPRGGQAS